MSWVHDAEAKVFFITCDACPEHFEAFAIPDVPSGLKTAERLGWCSLKRVGHDWKNYCRGCAHEAQLRHAKYKLDEIERERQKQRNA